jgi:hypothetical protein
MTVTEAYWGGFKQACADYNVPFEKVAQNMARYKNPLIGAGIGATLGGLSGALSPVDEEKGESRVKKLIQHMLLGGAGGAGLGYAYDVATKPTSMPDVPGAALDPLPAEQMPNPDSQLPDAPRDGIKLPPVAEDTTVVHGRTAPLLNLR